MQLHDFATIPEKQTADILVFKTNLRFKKDVKQVEDLLNAVKGIVRWTVDTEDCDKVLRIESKNISTHEIITILHSAGYFCEEMTA